MVQDGFLLSLDSGRVCKERSPQCGSAQYESLINNPVSLPNLMKENWSKHWTGFEKQKKDLSGPSFLVLLMSF